MIVYKGPTSGSYVVNDLLYRTNIESTKAANTAPIDEHNENGYNIIVSWKAYQGRNWQDNST